MEGHQGAKSFTINEAMGPANSQFSQISAQVQIKRVCPVCNKQFLWNEFDDHLRVHVEPQTYQITDVMNEQVLSHLMQNNFSHIVTITEGGNMQGVVQTLGPQVLTDPSALGHTQILLHTPNEPIQGTSFSDIKEMDNTLCNAAGTQIVLQTVEEAPLKYDNSSEASNTEMLLDAVSKSPVKPYQCAICDQSFKYSTELIRHTHSHGGKVQFQCHGVSFTVVGEPSLPKVDSAKTPEMKTYECHICHRQFPRSLILKAHMKVHSASKRFTCKTCGKQFPLQSYLTRHKRMHYNDSVYPCTSCTETFPTPHLLRAHGRSKHGDNVKDHRRQSDGLSGEMRAVNDARSTQPENSKLQCVACNKEFRVLSNLTRHIKMHYCEAKLPCSICHKQFKSEISLQYHKKVHQAWLRCTKCKKQFRNCSLYKKHKKLHKEDKLYQCDICQKQFSKKQCLEKHAKIHVRKTTSTQIGIRDESCINMKEQAKAAADGKPFACPKCEKSFRTVGLLESHVEVHDHGTEAPCLFCSKSFCNTDTLARHMKTKHMDCARKCPVCDRDFPTSDHFNRHMRIHTGEKPYECDVCQRRFSQAANLQTHKRTHTGEKPFKCHVCQKEFTNARNHRTHLVKQH